MLIGKENSVNRKLISQLSDVYDLKFVEFNTDLEALKEKLDGQSQIILVNLMDLNTVEDLPSFLHANFPELKIVAIHCFENEKMIALILDQGYDAYVSIFQLSEIFPQIFKDLGIEKGQLLTNQNSRK